MKKHIKKHTCIIGVIIFILLIIVFVSLKERSEATKEAKNYLEKKYPMMNYEIQETSSATKLSHYSRYHGYFKYAVNVQNMDTKETFRVFYDKKMKRLEDSLNIEKQEEYLGQNVARKVEKYASERFRNALYIDVNYNMEDGEPMVLVTFEEHHKDITQTEFDAFLAFLKETVGLEHGTVIIDYSSRIPFKAEF